MKLNLTNSISSREHLFIYEQSISHEQLFGQYIFEHMFDFFVTSHI